MDDLTTYLVAADLCDRYNKLRSEIDYDKPHKTMSMAMDILYDAAKELHNQIVYGHRHPSKMFDAAQFLLEDIV